MHAVAEPVIPSSLPHYLLLYLYTGHFLARWGARMWEFSVGLYMINVWPDSLLLAAVYGMVETASTAVFSPFIGQWIDMMPYTQVLQLWLFSQNISFMVAGVAVVSILVYSGLRFTNFPAFIVLVAFINIAGAFGVLSAFAGTILVEREWVVVISEGQNPQVLTKMNSIIRRIDLICLLFAPMATGFIISFTSLTASAASLALWNILSVCLQYRLFLSVYNGIPTLRDISQRKLRKEDNRTTTDYDEKALLSDSNEFEQLNVMNRLSNSSYISAWKVYSRQEFILPGLSLALLYFTVLSFGTLMTATLEWKGIQTYVIGIARGISGAFGISATFFYPILLSHNSTLQTGLLSIWSQWTCLLICVGSVFVNNKHVSAYMLMTGVATSRFGLWMFDLSVIQQMQDYVSESERGVVGGVQNSLQSILDLMTYTIGVVISNPQDFWKLIILSFVLVTLAGLLYTLHMYRVSKRVLDTDKFIQLSNLNI